MSLMADRPVACPRWTAPPWLRRLSVVATEQRTTPYCSMAPAQRFHIACDLYIFALTRLEEQATRRRCSIGELLLMYEQAGDRLRARG